jgi:hypothetical protein
MSKKTEALSSTAQAPDTATAPTDTIPWDDAVREGKAIMTQLNQAQLRLGELADKVVHPKYGDRTFAEYAKKLGIDKNTLGHYRTTYRAWKNILPPGAKSPPYKVLEVLASHPARAEIIQEEPTISKRRAEVHQALKGNPHREEILSENPNLTCTKEARKIASSYAGNGKGSDGADQTDFNESKRLLNKQLQQANEMIGTTEARKRCPPEQRRNLGKAAAMVPASLETMQRAGEEWLEYVAWLKELAAEGTETATREGRIKTSPKPAASSEPAQVGA